MGQDFLFSVVFFPILEELKLLSWGIGCHLPFGYIEFDFGELLVGDSQAAHLAIGRQGSLDAPAGAQRHSRGWRSGSSSCFSSFTTSCPLRSER